MRPIDADNLLKGIEELKQSPWYNFGKITGDNQGIKPEDEFYHRTYLERKEAIDVIVEQCIGKEPTIETEPVDDWINVDDRLPENDGLYIVCKTIGEHQIVFEARWQDGDWKAVVKNNHLDFITHWQPLPKPPKGE